MDGKKEISLASETWLKEDEHYITDRLTGRGFRRTGELLDLRVYDLLNICRIHAEVAEETVLTLYRVCNPNAAADEAMELGLTGQTFPLAGWRKKHRDPSAVTVRDLVMADGINRRAVRRLYGSVLKAFYRSGEYDGREYRYVSYEDLLRQKEEERKRKEEA